MRVKLFRQANRWLAGALVVLMAVSPAMGLPAAETKAKHGKTSAAASSAAARNKAHTKAAGKSGTSKKSAAKRSAAQGDGSEESAPTARRSARSRRSRKPSSHARRASRQARVAQTAKIHQEFVASTELRPMAQQLATLRSAEAYAAVTGYARRHSGQAAATAYLALGHAYLADRRYNEAEQNFRLARQDGGQLSDYADFLAARADHESGDNAGAEALLNGFLDRYPDSIFDAQVPELEANVLLALNNAQGARKVLDDAKGLAAEDRPGFQLALGQVDLALGERDAAGQVFKQLWLNYPLTSEAQTARARLSDLGLEATLTPDELSRLADAYYKAGRYSDAAERYRALMRISSLSQKAHDTFAVAEAACEWKLKRLTPAMLDTLPDSDDEIGARRLYLLMELARDHDNEADQQRIISQMESRFPTSPWLAEALFSSGNMYLLKRDYPRAVEYYRYLAQHFPNARHSAAAHWRAGWLTYRQRLYPEAASLFDEQIRLYPAAPETVAAIYWRGRLHETVEHNPALAASNYRAVIRAYDHYFYAQLAKVRLAALGDTQPIAQPQLDRLQPLPPPKLVDTFPVDSPHLAKARLLSNAGLNEYISQEIAADPDSASWSALAEAQMYASYGQTYRAMRALKRALPYAISAPIKSIPLAYWRILFPEPYWDTIKAEAAKNNLDPYLVASLIRQESEFNPSVVSYANAWGLMQLLPSVGKQLAREEGMSHFQTFQLLDPETNIKLGTRYLRETLDRFGGVREYALAAYNAGDSRVADWQAAGTYDGTDEFVESIPFTETREYVEAILRNMETYRAIDQYAQEQGERGGAQ